MHPSIDTSTLNLDIVRKRPTYTLPPTYRLGSYGMGCHLDAPGFPSYMIQPIYTSHGNSPRRAPSSVLNLDGVCYIVDSGVISGSWDEHHTKVAALMHRLWKPLPADSERVRLWMMHVYQHSAHCYHDEESTSTTKTLIYPVPYYELSSPREIRITPGTPDAEVAKIQEAIDAELARVTAENEAKELRAQRLATPENHKAVRWIREFYPDHQPMLEWISAPPSLSQADWWETSAERPTPETCQPRHSLVSGHGAWGWRHRPKSGAYCRFCGHTNP